MNDLSRVKFVQTPVLNIGYEEHGNTSGFPIILLHGFPYDIRSWDGVVPRSSKLGIGSLCLTFEDMDRLAFVIPSLLAWPNRPPSLKTLLTLQTLWDLINSHWRVLIGEIVLPVSRRSCILTESEVRLRSAVIRSRTPSQGAASSRCCRGETLVSVVLQYRAGADRSGRKPTRYHSLSLGDLVTQVGVYR